MNELRFGVLVPQDAPFPTLVERWRQAEAYGLDYLYVADHTRDYRDPGGHWFDGWTVLAAMAVATTRIRLGTLVSNPILRPPGLLAREAATVDHLSGGRLELGIGTGIAAFDHAAMGVEYWSAAERAARFQEYVAVVDGLLRSSSRPYSFDGHYHRTGDVSLVPGPAQRPRPPITVGGQSPSVLRVAAERADCWNTHGPFGQTFDQIVARTHRQNRALDEMCLALGREPTALRRSLLLFDVLDAWASPHAFEQFVSRFMHAGMQEFVVFWPTRGQMKQFEHVATETIPLLRSGGGRERRPTPAGTGRSPETA